MILYKKTGLKGDNILDMTCFDNEKYISIPLLKMIENDNGGLPFYIRKYTLNAGISTMLHRHEYLQINFICSGKGKHSINCNDFDIYKGDIFVMPPFVPHRIAASTDSDMVIYEFEFEPGFVNQSFESTENIESFFDFAYIEPFLVSEKSVKPCLNLSGRIQVDVEDILNEALKEYEEKPVGYKLLAKASLLKLLVLVGREFMRSLEKSEAGTFYCLQRDSILNAIKYINDHYADELSVEDIARRFSLSQSYFSYLFKTLTMKTFTEYLGSVRMSQAMELLRGSDKRVVDICFEVGFNNLNHFIRQFKRNTGRSPLSYRKSDR